MPVNRHQSGFECSERRMVSLHGDSLAWA